MSRWIEIRLKVPDNTAYTALVALRRLGVVVARVERARRDESLFNSNLHEAQLLETEKPGAGEVWIRSLDDARYARDDRVEAWRLFDGDGAPVPVKALRRACDALLCNPAIEEATLPS